MELFKMGNTDYTTSIVMPTYRVNRDPIYEDWTDANYNTHRCIARYKLNGSFTVWFDDESRFHSFMAQLSPSMNTGHSEGFVVADVFAVNENRLYQGVKVFVRATPAQTVPYFGIKDYEGFDVSIEER